MKVLLLLSMRFYCIKSDCEPALAAPVLPLHATFKTAELYLQGTSEPMNGFAMKKFSRILRS